MPDLPLNADIRPHLSGKAGDRQVILVVDDEEDIVESLCDTLRASMEDVEVRSASSGSRALGVLRQERVDLIITDYKMPGMNGLEFLAAAERVAPGVPRVLITAFPDLDIAIRAINEAGIGNFITKPFEADHVITVAKAILAERRSQAQRHQNFARSLELLRRQVRADP